MWKDEQGQNNGNDTDQIIDGFLHKLRPKPFTAAFISVIETWRRSFKNQGILIFQIR